MRESRWVTAALMTAALVVAGPATRAEASTITVDSVGQGFDLNWTLDLGGGNVLIADAHVLVTAISSSSVTLDFTVTNNTVGGSNEAIHAIGFDTNPNATSASITSGSYFSYVGLQQTFPGFQTIDVCVWTSTNCTGGTQPANLAPGLTDSFVLTLGGTWGTPPSLDMSRFVIKMQGDLGSYEFEGSVVPEPASLLLLGTGLTLVATGLRRRRSRSRG